MYVLVCTCQLITEERGPLNIYIYIYICVCVCVSVLHFGYILHHRDAILYVFVCFFILIRWLHLMFSIFSSQEDRVKRIVMKHSTMGQMNLVCFQILLSSVGLCWAPFSFSEIRSSTKNIYCNFISLSLSLSLTLSLSLSLSLDIYIYIYIYIYHWLII